jgi:hypothetical protein
MTRIPSEILFWFGPKLEAEGLRWAPKTFMQSETVVGLLDQQNDDTASVTKRGLQVHLSG